MRIVGIAGEAFRRHRLIEDYVAERRAEFIKRLEAMLDDLPPDQRDGGRIFGVVAVRRCVTLIKRLKAIPDDLAADERDRRILEVWDATELKKLDTLLLAGCPEADRWRAARQAALARKELLARLRTAIEAHQEKAIRELSNDPYMADYPLPSELVPMVNAARQGAVGWIEEMLRALRDEQPSHFAQLFDARLIRTCPERFAPYEPFLDQWIRSLVAPERLLSLGGKVYRVREDEEEGSCRVVLPWPDRRFSEQFILAICTDLPSPKAFPEETQALHRVTIDRESCEDGKYRLVNEDPEWIGAYVVVWAVVDLGFRTFYGFPLVLGRVPPLSDPRIRSYEIPLRETFRWFGDSGKRERPRSCSRVRDPGLVRRGQPE